MKVREKEEKVGLITILYCGTLSPGFQVTLRLRSVAVLGP